MHDETVNWLKHFMVVRPLDGLLRPIGLALSAAHGLAYVNSGTERRQTPFSQVFQYTLSGRGEFLLDGKVTPIKAGQGFLCCVADPRICYRYPQGESEPWRFLYLSFHDTQGIVASINERLGHVFTIHQDDAVIQRLAAHGDIEERNLEIDAGAAALLVQSVLSMLVDSARGHAKTDNVSIQLVRSAMKCIERNMNTPYNAAMLAGDLGISQEHLCRVFASELQRSPYQCICTAKMSRVCELLRGTRMSIKEIALHMGYEPGSHFARLFKRITGRTPTDYRKRDASPFYPLM